MPESVRRLLECNLFGPWMAALPAIATRMLLDIALLELAKLKEDAAAYELIGSILYLALHKAGHELGFKTASVNPITSLT